AIIHTQVGGHLLGLRCLGILYFADIKGLIGPSPQDACGKGYDKRLEKLLHVLKIWVNKTADSQSIKKLTIFKTRCLLSHSLDLVLQTAYFRRAGYFIMDAKVKIL